MKKIILTSLFLSPFGFASNLEVIFEKANQTYKDHKYSEAIIHVRNVLKQEPKHLAGQILIAEILMAQGHPETAEESIKKAIAFGVDKNQMQLLLAQTYILQGKYKEVFGLFPENQYHGDREVDILVIKGDAFLGLRQLQLAKATYEKAIGIDSKDQNALLGLAQLYLNEYNYEKALILVNQVLTDFVPPVKAWTLKASIEQSLANTKQALSDINQALIIEPNNLTALLIAASLNLQEQNYSKASDYANKILSEVPNEPRAEFILAMISADTNKVESSEKLEQVSEVLGHISDDVLKAEPAYYYLAGLILFNQKNYESARQYLDAYLLIDANNINALSLAATNEILDEKFLQARTILNRAKLIDEKNVKVLSLLGLTYFKLKQYETAEVYFNQVKSLAPDLPSSDAQLAQNYLAQGKVKQAIEHLLSENASQLDPSLVSLMLVQAHVKDNNLQKAQQIAQQLADAAPSNANYKHQLGYLHQIKGSDDKAKSSFEQALSIDKAHVQSIISLAQIEFNQGNIESAINRLQVAVNHNNTDAKLLVALAKAYQLSDQNQKANTVLTQAYDLDKGNHEILEALVKSYIKVGNNQKPIVLLKQAINNNPGNYEAHQLLADVYIREKDFQNAINNSLDAIKFGADKTKNYIKIARCYSLLNKVFDAESYYKKAIAWADGSLIPTTMLANLHIREGQLEKAKALISQTANIQPLNHQLHVLMAQVYYLEQDLTNAEIHYKNALELKFSEKVVSSLSLIYRQQGKVNKAKLALKNSLKQSPSNLYLATALAEIYIVEENWQEAGKVYQELVNAYPEQPAVLNNTGYIFTKLDRLDEAQVLLERSVNLYGNQADSIDSLAWVYYRQNKYEKSLPLFRKALALDYSNNEIKYHLALNLKALSRDKEAIQLLAEAFNDSNSPEYKRLLESWLN